MMKIPIFTNIKITKILSNQIKINQIQTTNLIKNLKIMGVKLKHLNFQMMTMLNYPKPHPLRKKTSINIKTTIPMQNLILWRVTSQTATHHLNLMMSHLVNWMTMTTMISNRRAASAREEIGGSKTKGGYNYMKLIINI